MTSVTFVLDASEPTPMPRALGVHDLIVRPPVDVARTRFDTFDGRLHAAGLRLELRSRGTSGSPAELILSGGGGGPAHLPLQEGRDPTRPLEASSLPSGPLRERLLVLSGERALLPQVHVTGRRQSGECRGSEGAPRVRIHLDTELGIGGQPAPWGGLVEVEELVGGTKAAARLRRALERQGLGGHPEDALELAAIAVGVDPAGWQGPPRVELDRRMPALTGFREALRGCAEVLEGTWQGTIDDLDPEFLHELRVAVRRARSLLAEGRRVLPGDVRSELRASFAWLGAVTGPARDLDVQVMAWPELTAVLPPPESDALQPIGRHLEVQRAAAYAEVAAALRSERAIGIREGFRGWLELSDDRVQGGREATASLGIVAADRLRAAQRQVLDAGRRIGSDSPSTELHQLRKDAKRLRYLLESFGALGGTRRTRAVVQELRRLQDNLGAFQDAQVQAERLRDAAVVVASAGGGGPEMAGAVASLADRLAARQTVARDHFAERFADYDRKAARRDVRDLLKRIER
jgi:CHAD domain-containing protein